MTDEIAVAVHNVSKRYLVHSNRWARLSHAFWPALAHSGTEVWALRDVSLEIKKGEAFAIIGRNGSGKSTLLEIITGTLKPTTGSVTVNGRITALLELGSGFNPEYTGRENVFLNGLLMGLSRQELENRFDEIAAFADIGPVLDRPAKTYSSGMLIRLAFAVQVALEPDILIIDEALSVGDYFFQQKCFSRIRKMRDNGLTLLFVSHDMGTVRDLCSRAAYLRKGQLLHYGESQMVIRHYFHEGSALSAAGAVDTAVAGSLPQFDAGVAWLRATELRRQLLAVRVVDSNGHDQLFAKIGDTLRIQVFFTGVADYQDLSVVLRIKNRYDQLVTSQSSRQLNADEIAVAANYFLYEFEIDLLLEAGLYSINVGLVQNAGTVHRHEIDATEWFGPIQVNWNYETDPAPFHGLFGLPMRGRYIPTNTESADATDYKKTQLQPTA